MRIRNGDWVKVTWIDSAGIGKWADIEDAETLTALDCTTVGHLLNRNDGMVRIAGTKGENESAIHIIAIPKVSVKKIIRLVEA